MTAEMTLDFEFEGEVFKITPDNAQMMFDLLRTKGLSDEDIEDLTRDAIVLHLASQLGEYPISTNPADDLSEGESDAPMLSEHLSPDVLSYYAHRIYETVGELGPEMVEILLAVVDPGREMDEHDLAHVQAMMLPLMSVGIGLAFSSIILGDIDAPTPNDS